MFLSVEAIQNIQRYSAHSNALTDSSLIICDGKTYQVFTQNLVFKNKIPELKERLDLLATKSKEELEQIYISKIEAEESTEKGAGLGLIEIARKSGNNIYYDFIDLTNELSIFNLCFSLPVDKNEEIVADFASTLKLHTTLVSAFKNNKSSLLYNGDFSNNFLRSVLELLLSKRSEEKANASKKIHHVFIELIQNIKRHAKGENENAKGKMLLEWHSSGIDISTYNTALNKDVEELNKKVVTLNSLTKEELDQKSKEILSDFNATNGLGLIDIANLIHPNKIELEVHDLNNSFSELLFTLRIKNE